MRLILLLTLSFFLAPNPAFAQEQGGADSASSVPLYRNPSRARALSIIPGWGYVYTGEYVRGYGVWVMTAAGPIMGASFFAVPCGFLFIDCPKSRELLFDGVGIALIAASVWNYASSIRDAPRSAERANDRHARDFKVAPILTPSMSGRAWRAGVSLGW